MKHAYLDEYSRLDGFLQRLEPRVKILGFFSYIIFVISTPAGKLETLALYGIVSAVLLLLSRIPLAFIFVRSLAVIPFALMVAFFLPFMGQGRSAAGLILFESALIKAYLSILCLILLTASTPFGDLLKALEKLKLPALIAMVLSFMYRYFFVIQDEFMRIQQAKAARGGRQAGWRDLSALANMAGVLFLRSYEKSEAVYLAMCARGFDGKIRTISSWRITRKDIFFLAALFIVLAGISLAGK